MERLRIDHCKIDFIIVMQLFYNKKNHNMSVKYSFCINGITLFVIVQYNKGERTDCIVVNQHNDVVELFGKDGHVTNSVYPFVFTGTKGGKKGAVYFRDDNYYVYNANLSKIIGTIVFGKEDRRNKERHESNKAYRKSRIDRKF
jgi:hypothetical protein